VDGLALGGGVVEHERLGDDGCGRLQCELSDGGDAGEPQRDSEIA
jgi:hypothetical protein